MERKQEPQNEKIKKVYPSELSTKSMACRVPIVDYVKFQKEAISQGINLNDWLLAKIYSEQKESEVFGANLKESMSDQPEIMDVLSDVERKLILDNINMLVEMIIRNEALLVFPGEDFENGFVISYSSENGINRTEIDQERYKNLHKKFSIFLQKKK